MLSALTILGLRETESRYATYADIAASNKHKGWRRAGQTLDQMYRRLVFNVCIGNNIHPRRPTPLPAQDVPRRCARVNLTAGEADEIIGRIVDTIRSVWDDICDQAMLTTAEREVLFGREMLNDHIFWDRP